MTMGSMKIVLLSLCCLAVAEAAYPFLQRSPNSDGKYPPRYGPRYHSPPSSYQPHQPEPGYGDSPPSSYQPHQPEPGYGDHGNHYDYAEEHYGYESQCPEGFREDGHGKCIDVDECTKGRVIQCGLNADCYNKRGSFRCVCRPGFKKNKHGHCMDMDECKDQIDLCTGNENCVNVIGTYNCLCKASYVRDAHGDCKQIGWKEDSKDRDVYASPVPKNRYPPPHYPAHDDNYGYPPNYDDNHGNPPNYGDNHGNPPNYGDNHGNPPNYGDNHGNPPNYGDNHGNPPNPTGYPTTRRAYTNL